MSKEYHYVIKYTQNGWEIDVNCESARFPDGTIYDRDLEEWQFGYLGDGNYNGKEEELTDTLTSALAILNGATNETN
jgi:hypothetical protein